MKKSSDFSETNGRVPLERVAQIDLRKGLRNLSEKYRARLDRENRLNIPSEQVWAELHRIREEIAENDYSD